MGVAPPPPSPSGPVPPASPVPATSEFAAAGESAFQPICHDSSEEVTKETNSADRDPVVRTLCDYMIQALERGLRLQKVCGKPGQQQDYIDMLCLVTEDHKTLQLGRPSYDGEGVDPAQDIQEYPVETIGKVVETEVASSTGRKDRKLQLLVHFTDPRFDDVTLQCKDRAVFVNFLDGIGALMGHAPRTAERIADLGTIKELFDYTKLYGPPVPPPLPAVPPV